MKKMDIIYEDKEILVINKPAKLLTVSTLKEKDLTLFKKASDYVKKKHPRNKVFIVNRLDKETSGIVIFAKNESIKKKLQESWSKMAIVREYLAIVEGHLESKKGTLRSFLKEDKFLRVFVSNEGDLAITHYEVIATTTSYSLVKIRIDTGRKNQIRVQFAHILHPIIGDKKYKSHKNPLGRLGLHASLVILKKGNEEIKLKAKIPKEFYRIFNEEIKKYESLI